MPRVEVAADQPGQPACDLSRDVKAAVHQALARVEQLTGDDRNRLDELALRAQLED